MDLTALVTYDDLNIPAATPAEIDAVLAQIDAAVWESRTREDYAYDSVERMVRDHLGLRRYEKPSREQVRDTVKESTEAFEAGDADYATRQIAQRWAEYCAHTERTNDLRMSAQPLDEEWERRGRWTRAFLVVNANGHVHRSQYCSTCFPTTRYHWVTEFSGKNETEIVEAAGERACTVCYPSAPAEVLNRPTRMFTPDEVAKQQAREERAAKKAAADALKVIVEDFPTRLIRPDRIEARRKEFKTVRAATQAAVDARYDAIWRGRLPHLVDEAQQAVDVAEAIERALAEKTDRTVEDVRAEILAKAEKKVQRNGW